MKTGLETTNLIHPRAPSMLDMIRTRPGLIIFKVRSLLRCCRLTCVCYNMQFGPNGLGPACCEAMARAEMNGRK